MKKKVKPTIVHAYNETFKQNYYLVTRCTHRELLGVIMRQSEVHPDQESMRPFMDENRIPAATTVWIPATSQIFIWLRDSSDITSLVHECVHAVQYTLDHRGVNDRETSAYLTEYLFRKFMEKI